MAPLGSVVSIRIDTRKALGSVSRCDGGRCGDDGCGGGDGADRPGSREVAEVVDRLRDRRLVTLIGPAGIGKTALALLGAGPGGGKLRAGRPLRRPDPRRLPRRTSPGTIAASARLRVLRRADQLTVRTARAGRGGQLRARHGGRGRCRRRACWPRASRPGCWPPAGRRWTCPASRWSSSARSGVPAARHIRHRHRRRAAVPRPRPRRGRADRRRAVGCRRAAVPAPGRRAPRVGAGRRADQDDAAGRDPRPPAGGPDVLVRARFRGPDRHRSLAGHGRLVVPAAARRTPPRCSTGSACSPGPFTAELAARRRRRRRSRRGERPTGRWRCSSTPRSWSPTRRRSHAVPAAGDRADVRAAPADRRRARRRGPSIGSSTTSSRRPAARCDGGAPVGPGAFGRLLALYDNAVAALRWCLAHDDDGDRGAHCSAPCSGGWCIRDTPTRSPHSARRRWPAGPIRAAPFAADAIATAATARFLMGDPAGALALAQGRPGRGRRVPDGAGAAAPGDGLRRPGPGRMPGRARVVRRRGRPGAERGLPALASEADVNRAQLLANAGDLAAARAVAEAALAEAVEAGSPINEVWAQSVLAQFELRAHGARRARRGVGRAGRGAAARLFVGDRREPADARVGADRRRPAPGGGGDAARAVRSGPGTRRNRRAARRAAHGRRAAVRHGNASWGVVAATALSLPPAGPTGSALDGLARLPHIDVTPIERRDAVRLVRRALLEYLAIEPAPPAAAQIHGAAIDVAAADRPRLLLGDWSSLIAQHISSNPRG